MNPVRMTIDYQHLTEQLERVHSGRLAMRRTALSDAWPLFLATRNPLFNRFLMWDSPANDLHALDRVESIIDAARRGRLTAMSAVVKSTGEWVSLFRFQPYMANPASVEMGVWTHDKFWHGRYSLELGRLCVDAAFALSDIPVLVGASAPQNKSSCRLMELCGLTPSKLVYRQTEGGSTVPLQEFEISRATWGAKRDRANFVQVPLRTGAAAPQASPALALRARHASAESDSQPSPA